MRAVIQIRGEIDMNSGQRDTLDMLNIGRVNHATLVPENDVYNGMVAKVNDFVAHGEPSIETLTLVLEKRADALDSSEAVDAEFLAENTDYDSFQALAEALVAEETTLREQGLSPTLRLHPPRGGHDGIKHPDSTGGELGPHEDIDPLLEAMR
ncbi:MAG: 50S ribosomal protein L30 [Halolamina sp.]|jgi:large subunit ribosomal protein L30|uniref:50S ribosomal protein L30 n=1 Tax=Halolamina sp. TaxID=1940283 RepID=UPI002FC30AAD